MTIIVGIDPGVTTGVAMWYADERRLVRVDSMMIHQAMRYITDERARLYDDLLVVFEDCRQHRVFGKGQRNDAALQGVGSVKRDCGIWDDFLTDNGIPFITRTPSRRRTKFTAEQFQSATGWTGRSNNHGRDAAMLVAGIPETQARAWMVEAKQRGKHNGTAG